MMRRLLIIGLLMLNFFGMANAVEILRWDRIPLALPLIAGQERIVFVDQNVRVGLPRNLVISCASRAPVAHCTFWPKNPYLRLACSSKI